MAFFGITINEARHYYFTHLKFKKAREGTGGGCKK